jgi:ATP-dependent RNA/DNA helicase IGHMBP2
VLACAPSNIAVDNMMERVHEANPKLKIVRIGHPARLLESVQHLCLDALVSSQVDYAKQTNDIRKEINKLNKKVLKCKSKAERKELWGEYKMLKKDLRSIEQAYIN